MTFEALLWVVRERNPRILRLGRSSTYLADQLHEIALVWMGWELTRSSTLTALAVLATRAPLWALGSFAGVYADRLPRQLTIIATDNTKRIARLFASFLIVALQHLLPVSGFYAIAGFAYLAMSGCAGMFLVRSENSSRGTGGGFFSEFVDGWRAFRAGRVVFLTVACFALYSPAYAAAYWVGLPRLAGDTLAGVSALTASQWARSQPVASRGISALLSSI
jgi:hypothetical protein